MTSTPARIGSLLALGLALAFGLPLPAAHAQDAAWVNAEGEGMSADAARRDALRKALEQGGAVEIASRSKVENFTLIRDTIFSRADGIITHYEVVQEGEGVGGTYFCKIKAKVSKSAIASTWGEVQNVLEQLGRPGIMVYIQERVDGEAQPGSIFESQIENRLLKAGFDLYDRKQLDAITDREMADAVVTNNVAKMQAIAKNFATQIFITGTADANMAGNKNLYGERTAMYNADGVIKMFYTDSGKLIASEPLTNCRGGSRTHFTDSLQAGKKALQECAAELAERCYQNAMRNWATQISAGGMLVLEIEGIRIADSVRLKKQLSDLDPDKILNVNRSFSKDIATYRIKAKMTGEDLLEYLVEGEWPTLIEITDQQGSRIQAKWIAE
ncbi:MAG: hypothetical protein PVI86_19530 [Phycisphaerae bacterium]|jgi:hypothetical protein